MFVSWSERSHWKHIMIQLLSSILKYTELTLGSSTKSIHKRALQLRSSDRARVTGTKYRMSCFYINLDFDVSIRVLFSGRCVLTEHQPQSIRPLLSWCFPHFVQLTKMDYRTVDTAELCIASLSWYLASHVNV